MLALIGMGVIAFVGLKRDRVVNDTVWRDPSADFFIAPVQSMVPPSEEEALELVRTVLAMTKTEQFGSRVHLNGMTAEQAVDFLVHREERDGKLKRMDWIGNMDANNIQIEAVQLVFEKETTPVRRALLTPNKNGDWQVDIASLANWNSVPWDRFLNEPGSEADLRVAIARDNYFNGEYSSDREWSAYRLVSPESETALIGYCRKDGPISLAISSLLKEAAFARVVLRVRKAEAPGNRQCEILSVLAEDWIVTETPVEGRFQKSRPLGRD
ncbi:MAG: hypothetical protein CFE26_07830 [Verrucomicrobiales bacterium VVV1]|nr:MAG: hypothetical protein CFE26_07830 [Verrucomicrobiales bacterium VVV1]